MLPEQRGGDSSRVHYIFATIFGIIALVALIGLIMVNTQADDTSQTAGVTNVVPTFGTPTLSASSLGASLASSGINLTENTSTTLYIYGTATDLNGCEQIDDADGNGSTSSLWSVAFYRSSMSAQCGFGSSSPSFKECYNVVEEDSDLTGCTGAGDTTLNYEFDVPVAFYADATDAGSNPDYSTLRWYMAIKIYDDQGGFNAPSWNLSEMNTLKALDVTSTKDYGSVSLGATSTQQTITITNTGNDNDLDPTISQASAWTCTIGTIPIANLGWSITEGTTGTGHFQKTSTTSSAVDTNRSITKATTSTASTATIYTSLYIPTSGVSGTCTSTLTFTAA